MSQRSDSQAITPLVSVVDDDEDIRHAVITLVRSVGLEAQPFAAGADFLNRGEFERPGCIVLDVRMPGMSGIDVHRELRSRAIPLPIIFLTAHGEVETAIQALRTGALDFLLKPYSPQTLLERIQEAIDRSVRNWQERQQVADGQRKLESLSRREREVMDLLVQGASTKVIALRLQISPKTAANHCTRIMEKIGVDNATQLSRVVWQIADPGAFSAPPSAFAGG